MTEPFQHDPYQGDSFQHDPIRGDATQRGARAVPHPAQRNRNLLIIAGLALLALLLAIAVWQNSGTRGAKNDFASANEKVVAKEREVEDARRLLDQRIAELKVVRAEADVQAAKLGNKVEQQVGGAIDEARTDVPAATSTPLTGRATDPYTGPAPVYYVRDQQGRFVPVTRP
jgi:FtsZ-interacting cell division protein ZipA